MISGWTIATILACAALAALHAGARLTLARSRRRLAVHNAKVIAEQTRAGWAPTPMRVVSAPRGLAEKREKELVSLAVELETERGERVRLREGVIVSGLSRAEEGETIHVLCPIHAEPAPADPYREGPRELTPFAGAYYAIGVAPDAFPFAPTSERTRDVWPDRELATIAAIAIALGFVPWVRVPVAALATLLVVLDLGASIALRVPGPTTLWAAAMLAERREDRAREARERAAERDTDWL